MKQKLLLLCLVLFGIGLTSSAQVLPPDLEGLVTNPDSLRELLPGWNPDWSLMSNVKTLEQDTATNGTRRAPKLNTIVTASDLPDHWNNAETMYFPPVFNQNGGSCGVSSRVGYMLNEEMNAYNGTDASLATNRLAQNFQFPFSYGKYSFDKSVMAKYVGYPSSDVWGGTSSSSIYGSHGSESNNDDGWMQGYDSWYNAMKHRITKTANFPKPALTAEGQEAMKRWLYNHNGDTSFKTGGLLGIGCSAGSNHSWTIGSCAHNDSLGFSNMYGLAWGSSVDHACTICGYDDRVWFDLDQNGEFGEEENSLGQDERGAWIMVNTWGNWLNGGFAYHPYALATPTTTSTKILRPGATDLTDSVTVYTAVGTGYTPEVYYYRKDYTPQQTLKATMTFVQRQQMGLTVGIAQDTTATAPEKSTRLYHFYYNGDRYNSKAMIPMLGKWSDGQLHYEPMEFGYDLTDLAADFDRTKPLKYFLTVETSDSCTGYGGIHAASIIDYETNKNGVETMFKIVGDSVAINGANVSKTISVIVWNEPLAPPCNLATASNTLSWDAPLGTSRTPLSYMVYRDDVLIDSTTTRTYSYGGTTGSYSVKAVYQINGDKYTSPASEKVRVRTSADLAKDNYTYTFSNMGFQINDVFSSSMDQATIEWWVKPSSLTDWNQQIGPDWGTFLIHTTSTGGLVAGWNTSNRFTTSSSTLVKDSWKHIAVVVDGNTMTAYVNGIQKGTVTSSSFSGMPAMSAFEFGSHYSGSNALYGVYDEVRIWKTARTATDIANNYKTPLIDDVAYGDLLAYYRMDTFTSDGTLYLRDCVGGHHAPLVGTGSSQATTGNSHFTNYTSQTLNLSINAPSTAVVGEPITLTYNGTADITSRTWSCTGQTSSTVAAWNISFTSTGTKTVTLQVRTLNNVTKTATATIVVSAAPAATASFSQSATEVTGSERVSFVSANKTPNCTYSWSMPGADVETMDTRNASASYSNAGTYNVTLTVTDANGNSTSSTKQVVVHASAPVISFDQSASVIYKGQSVTFTDNSLYNPTTWRWQLQCGNDTYTEFGRTVTFTPQRAGTYNVTLTAINEVGSTMSTTNKALIVCNAKSKTGLRMSSDTITTNISSPEMTDGAWTIDFWYNPSSMSTNCNSITTSNGLLDFHGLGNGDAELLVNNLNVGTWSSCFTLNEWHHYALTASNDGSTSTYILYRDGVSLGSLTQSSVQDWNTAMKNLIVGGSNGKFDGHIDEFRVWNKTLTLSEIKTYCVEPISTSTTGLKVYYNFNSIESGLVSDSTSNHYNGSRTYSGPTGDVYMPSEGVFALDFSEEVGFQPYGTRLDQTLLTLDDYSDEELSSESRPAANIIDDNTSTFWHSKYSSPAAGYPHYFQFSRTQYDTIQSIVLYTNRQGNVYYPKTMNVEVSEDNQTWTTIESDITFPNKATVGITLLEPIKEKYFRLSITSGYNSSYLILTEIYLYGKTGPVIPDDGQKAITYVVKDTDGSELARRTELVDEGSELSLPDILKKDYCTYSEVSGYADDNKTVEVTCTYNFPFEVSTNRSNAHYYYMKVRSAYANANGTTNVQLSSTKSESTGLWAFLGNPYDGFQLVNASNTALTLYASDDPVCSSSSTSYPYLSENNTTNWTVSKYSEDESVFSLNIVTVTQTLFLNKFANGSLLGYWTSGTSDVGSRITIEDYGVISDGTVTIDPSKLYYIHNSYSSWSNNTYLYANNGVVSPGTKVADNNNYLWRLVYDSDSTKVQVVNVGTNQKIYIDNVAADENLKLGDVEYKWSFIEGDGGVMVNTINRAYSWYTNPNSWPNNIITKDHWGYGWIFEPVTNYADTVTTKLGGYFTTPTNGYVGTLTAADSASLRSTYDAYAAVCTQAQYQSLKSSIDNATIKIESGKPYRLLNAYANYTNHWMALNMATNGNSTGAVVNTADPTNNLSTLLMFEDNGDNTWTVTIDGLYITPNNQGTEVLSATAGDAAAVSINNQAPGVFALCTQTSYGDYGCLHDNGNSSLVCWTEDAAASHWYIIPADSIKIGLSVVNGISYGTLYVPFSVTIDEDLSDSHLLNFYKVSELNSNNIVARRIDSNVIPASTPVIIRDVNASTTLTLAVGGNGAAVTENVLVGTLVNKTIDNASNTYVLTSTDGGNSLSFAHCSTAYIPANKAYYIYSGTGTPKFGFDNGDGNITWIDGLTLDGNNTDSDAIYDLQGRKVNSNRATGGIYIVNGKKVLVK